MNRLIHIVMTVLLICSWLIGATVKNPEKPEKGQWDFKPQKKWQLDAIGNDLLVNVSDIKADQKGNLYIAEVKNMKFYILNPDGKLLASFGKKGQGPGELANISTFYLFKNYLIVPDLAIIHYFSTKGELIKDVKLKKWLHHQLLIDEDQLIILSKFPFQVKKNDPNYIELYNLKTNSSKKLTKLKLKEEILRYAKGGIRVAIPLKNTTPKLVMATDFKALFYGNSGKYQINKIDFTGKELLSFSIEGRKKNRVSKITKTKHFKNNASVHNEPQEVVEGLFNMVPDESPYFYQMFIDTKGWIYVLLIDLENPDQQAIDIFSPEGKYLYRSVINLSNDFENILTLAFSFAKSELFVFGDEVEGERQLVKYKISLPD